MRRFWSRLSFHVQIFLLLVCLFQLEEIKCNTVGPEGRVSVPCVLEDLDCCQKGGSWNSSVLQLHSSLLFLPLLLPSLPRCTGNCLLLRKMKDVPAFTNPKQVFEPLGTWDWRISVWVCFISAGVLEGSSATLLSCLQLHTQRIDDVWE